MPRQLQKLTAAKIKRLIEPGLYPDGQSLYLRVKSPTSKSWVFRYMRNNRPRMMGLGSADTVTLAEARDLAVEQRRLLARDIDPIGHRKAQRRRSDIPTFAEAAESYIQAQSQGWKSRKHEQQWRNTLETYAFPVIGSVTVDDIQTDHIRRILDNIWYRKPETASRVRGRIEAILSWSKALDLRSGEKPALWRGHLDQIYPTRSRFKPLQHQKMLSWRETPNFYEALANSDLLGSRPLMFAILTAARRNDIISALWSQIDLAAEIPIWTVPASALKGHKRDDHRVPLADAAISVLDDLNSRSNQPGEFVFRVRLRDWVAPANSHSMDFDGHSAVGRPSKPRFLEKLLKQLWLTRIRIGLRPRSFAEGSNTTGAGMSVSEYFKLGKTQPYLDFVDIRLDTDIEVFVDPTALRGLKSPWGHECASIVQNYFETVLARIKTGRHDDAKRLVRPLRERDEFHPGLFSAKTCQLATGRPLSETQTR